MFVAEHFLSNIVRLLKLSSLNRWGNMITNDLGISSIKVSYSFGSGEKPDREENAVHQGYYEFR